MVDSSAEHSKICGAPRGRIVQILPVSIAFPRVSARADVPDSCTDSRRCSGALLLPVVVASGAAIGILTRLAPVDACCAAIVCASISLFSPRRATMALGMAALGSLCAAHGAMARDRTLFSPLQEWFDQKALRGRADDGVEVRRDRGRRVVLGEWRASDG